VFIRTLLALVLYELSLVTRPAYQASQAELRAQALAHPVRNQPKGVWLP
jgi:phage head maturation protease